MAAELVGSRIEDIVAKARENPEWEITATSKHVDFFHPRDYPFRVDVDGAGAITRVHRPKFLMDRYDAMVEERTPPMHWDGERGWVEGEA